jgi:hypothetical protein
VAKNKKKKPKANPTWLKNRRKVKKGLLEKRQ